MFKEERLEKILEIIEKKQKVLCTYPHLHKGIRQKGVQHLVRCKKQKDKIKNPLTKQITVI